MSEILAEKDIIISNLQKSASSNYDTFAPTLNTQITSDSKLIITNLEQSLKKAFKENESLTIKHAVLEKNYSREKRLVEEKVREINELQARVYEDSYEDKRDLLESRSVNDQMQQSLQEEQIENQKKQMVILKLKSQMTTQMKELQNNFSEVENKHKGQQESMREDLNVFQNMKAMMKD